MTCLFPVNLLKCQVLSAPDAHAPLLLPAPASPVSLISVPKTTPSSCVVQHTCIVLFNTFALCLSQTAASSDGALAGVTSESTSLRDSTASKAAMATPKKMDPLSSPGQSIHPTLKASFDYIVCLSPQADYGSKRNPF